MPTTGGHLDELLLAEVVIPDDPAPPYEEPPELEVTEVADIDVDADFAAPGRGGWDDVDPG